MAIDSIALEAGLMTLGHQQIALDHSSKRVHLHEIPHLHPGLEWRSSTCTGLGIHLKGPNDPVLFVWTRGHRNRQGASTLRAQAVDLSAWLLSTAIIACLMYSLGNNRQLMLAGTFLLDAWQ